MYQAMNAKSHDDRGDPQLIFNVSNTVLVPDHPHGTIERETSEQAKESSRWHKFSSRDVEEEHRSPAHVPVRRTQRQVQHMPHERSKRSAPFRQRHRRCHRRYRRCGTVSGVVLVHFVIDLTDKICTHICSFRVDTSTTRPNIAIGNLRDHIPQSLRTELRTRACRRRRATPR